MYQFFFPCINLFSTYQFLDLQAWFVNYQCISSRHRAITAARHTRQLDSSSFFFAPRDGRENNAWSYADFSAHLNYWRVISTRSLIMTMSTESQKASSTWFAAARSATFLLRFPKVNASSDSSSPPDAIGLSLRVVDKMTDPLHGESHEYGAQLRQIPCLWHERYFLHSELFERF